MPTKDSTACRMSARPWRRGWLEYRIHNGSARWWSSSSITVESIRILGGMTVVTFKVNSIWKISSLSLTIYLGLSSGYRLVSDSLSSVFWHDGPLLATSLSKSVIHSFRSLDDMTVAASPTLRALRHECQKMHGGS